MSQSLNHSTQSQRTGDLFLPQEIWGRCEELPTPMQLDPSARPAATGKLIPPACVGAAAGESMPTKRLLVTDRKTSTRFLVDTGADVSVLPRIWAKNATRTNRLLYAANHSEIVTYGERRLILDLGLRRDFAWIFIVANVTQPILGNDFLHAFNLLPDLRGRRLLDATTKLTTGGRLTTADSPALTTIGSGSAYQDVLRRHDVEVTRPVNHRDPRHSV